MQHLTPFLSQSTHLGQRLAPNMRQSLKMLQMTLPELRTEIRQQLTTNPVIEEVQYNDETPFSSALPDEHTSGAVTERELDFTPGGEAAETILSTDDGYRDYFLGNLENASSDEAASSRRQQLFDSLVKTETLQQYLLSQIPLSNIPPEHQALAATLIGNIDDDGYFRGSIPDIQMVTRATKQDIEQTLAHIQALDPPGCGARTLQECLLAQLDKLNGSPRKESVRRLIQDHLDHLADRRTSIIRDALHVSPEDYTGIVAALHTLDPRPGRSLKRPSLGRARDIHEKENIITPEAFAVKNQTGNWRILVPTRDIPKIRLSAVYQQMAADPSCPAETRTYLREHIRAALALNEALENRQETIRKISQAILNAQSDVFNSGDLSALKPLTMQEIADKTGVHATTVSRTVRDKYLATPFGTFELRRFFTAGLATETGETVSNTSVQEKLRTLIEQEDRAHPLSDDRLTALLNRQGISIKRRTVAKYRTALTIPAAQQRRITSL